MNRHNRLKKTSKEPLSIKNSLKISILFRKPKETNRHQETRLKSTNRHTHYKGQLFRLFSQFCRVWAWFWSCWRWSNVDFSGFSGSGSGFLHQNRFSGTFGRNFWCLFVRYVNNSFWYDWVTHFLFSFVFQRSKKVIFYVLSENPDWKQNAYFKSGSLFDLGNLGSVSNLGFFGCKIGLFLSSYHLMVKK